MVALEMEWAQRKLIGDNFSTDVYLPYDYQTRTLLDNLVSSSDNEVEIKALAVADPSKIEIVNGKITIDKKVLFTGSYRDLMDIAMTLNPGYRDLVMALYLDEKLNIFRESFTNAPDVHTPDIPEQLLYKKPGGPGRPAGNAEFYVNRDISKVTSLVKKVKKSEEDNDAVLELALYRKNRDAITEKKQHACIEVRAAFFGIDPAMLDLRTTTPSCDPFGELAFDYAYGNPKTDKAGSFFNNFKTATSKKSEKRKKQRNSFGDVTVEDGRMAKYDLSIGDVMHQLNASLKVFDNDLVIDLKTGKLQNNDGEVAEPAKEALLLVKDPRALRIAAANIVQVLTSLQIIKSKGDGDPDLNLDLNYAVSVTNYYTEIKEASREALEVMERTYLDKKEDLTAQPHPLNLVEAPQKFKTTAVEAKLTGGSKRTAMFWHKTAKLTDPNGRLALIALPASSQIKVHRDAPPRINLHQLLTNTAKKCLRVSEDRGAEIKNALSSYNKNADTYVWTYLTKKKFTDKQDCSMYRAADEDLKKLYNPTFLKHKDKDSICVAFDQSRHITTHMLTLDKIISTLDADEVGNIKKEYRICARILGAIAAKGQVRTKFTLSGLTGAILGTEGMDRLTRDDFVAILNKIDDDVIVKSHENVEDYYQDISGKLTGLIKELNKKKASEESDTISISGVTTSDGEDPSQPVLDAVETTLARNSGNRRASVADGKAAASDGDGSVEPTGIVGSATPELPEGPATPKDVGGPLTPPFKSPKKADLDVMSPAGRFTRKQAALHVAEEFGAPRGYAPVPHAVVTTPPVSPESTTGGGEKSDLRNALDRRAVTTVVSNSSLASSIPTLGGGNTRKDKAAIVPTVTTSPEPPKGGVNAWAKDGQKPGDEAPRSVKVVLAPLGGPKKDPKQIAELAKIPRDPRVPSASPTPAEKRPSSEKDEGRGACL